MTRPSDTFRPSRCVKTGKVCYASRLEAEKHGRTCGAHGSGYRCTHCGWHHFTSQPKRVSRAIRLLLRSMA